MPRVGLSSTFIITVLLLSGCASTGDEPTTEDSSASDSPTESPETPSPSESAPSSEEPAAPTVEVRIANERVAPNAEQVDLTTGESMVFEIVSDRAGELHVHSKPEQFVKFGTGRTRAEISMDTPGSVKVEEHDTGAVVAIVEVR